MKEVANERRLQGGFHAPQNARRDLSPPTFHQRYDAGTYNDNNNDGGKRLHGGQGLVPVAPKPKHAPASVESAVFSEKILLRRDDKLLRRKCNATFRRARFDRAAT
jgi:hypothetical protein